MNGKFKFLIMALLVALLASFGAGCNADKEDQATAEIPTSAAVAARVGGRVGDQAPDFELTDINGGKLKLSSLRGKLVIVDFWDTWCPPCRKALPHLEELHTEYSKDMVVVGIAMARFGPEKVNEYMKSHNFSFECVIGDAAVTKSFGGIASIPTTFLVDADGKIIKKWTGGHSKQEYENAVRQTLGI